MEEYQLKFDIFNVKTPIIEEEIKHEVKRDNKAKVVLKEAFIEVIKTKENIEENKKEEVIEINI